MNRFDRAIAFAENSFVSIAEVADALQSATEEIREIKVEELTALPGQFADPAIRLMLLRASQAAGLLDGNCGTLQRDIDALIESFRNFSEILVQQGARESDGNGIVEEFNSSLKA